MSIPTDSVAPAPPTGSSNPWSMPLWWKRITDWIAALSPSGASEYDTGWVDIPVASGFTGGAGAAAPRVRRIGSLVSFKGTISGTLTADVSTSLGTIPAAFRTPANDGRQQAAGSTTGGQAVYYMSAASDGSIFVRVATTGVHNVCLGALGYPID